MVTLVRHDLEFILKQIVIAEQHASGTPLTDLIEHPLLPYGLRTVDGSYNNLVAGREQWGASQQPFLPLTNADHRTGSGSMGSAYAHATNNNNNDYGQSGSVVDYEPRLISNLIVDQTLDNPAAIAAALRDSGLEGQDLLDVVSAIVAAHKAVKAAEGNSETLPDTIALLQSQIAVIQANIDALTPETEFLRPFYVAALAERQTQLETAMAGGSELVQARQALADLLDDHDIQMDGLTVLIPNKAPDEGLSASYNSIFTIFGQFFDHGLDLVAKGGNGTVYMPLSPDDPLYNPATPHTNFMVLTRVTTGDAAGNAVTPWIDQNQTYTSNASHQVFLREYKLVDGKPVATGHLLESPSGGLATWGDVKKQAKEMLGIDLQDADVLNVPVVAVDAYGNFIPGENGFAQLMVGLTGGGQAIYKEGHPDAPLNPHEEGAARTGIAFLDDIAHDAALFNSRGQKMYADHDDVVGMGVTLIENPNYVAGYQPPANGPDPEAHLLRQLEFVAIHPDFDPALDESAANPRYINPNRFYDNEKLDKHFITGDGRGNENIALSAIHFVFHAEHNRLIEHTKTVILDTGDLAFLNSWLRVPVAELPTTDEAIGQLQWHGERLFQVGRFTTEMQYQHLVFEEFARSIQPDIDIFDIQAGKTIVDINPAIFAEFAHVVYRFGHSMLNETVERVNSNGERDDIDLFGAFLNPMQFSDNGMTQAQAAGAIMRGMSGQVGNEIDEFVTNVLRNELVGLPLDLAAINIARGRETGMPTLNQARAQFMEMTDGDTRLKPYESWSDFALHLANPASIVNFIAAYGRHSIITAATTIEGKRDAAMTLVFGSPDETAAEKAARLAWLNAPAAQTGVDDIDLWIGGLAERKMLFGGMLGSTFSFVFELQLENLQDGDRFYYLSRTQGLNLGTELEQNSLAKMIMRNTDLGATGFALPDNVFFASDHVFYVDFDKQMMLTGLADPEHSNPFLQAVSRLVERKTAEENGGVAFFRYNGFDHITIAGTEGDDHIISGGGDDTIWGFGGNDRIEVGNGVDHVDGGDGDDIITSTGTDIGAVAMLKGGAGNDVIHAGSGTNLVFGGSGKDFLVAGKDGGEMRGGTGDDFMLGGDGFDVLFGNEGDDWIEAGGRFDGVVGDNGDIFFNSTIVGHDVLNGGSGDTDYDADSGDDIMFAGEGIQKFIGVWGHDWVIFKGQPTSGDADMNFPIFDTLPAEVLRDRYDQVEAVSGWIHDDVIRGDDRTFEDGVDVIFDPTPEGNFRHNELDEAAIARISGLSQIVKAEMLVDGEYWADGSGVTKKIFAHGNILLGGGGSDTFEGRGGDDIIDGDAWLNVRIRIVGYGEQNTEENEIATVDSLKDAVTINGVTKPLTTWMVEGAINPSQLHIVREILWDDSGIDTAVYWDVRANYEITYNADGSIIVEHITQTAGAVDPITGRNRQSDGRDTLYNIERIRFADMTISANRAPNPIEVAGRAIVGSDLVLDLDSVSDPDGITEGTTSISWQVFGINGWTQIPGGTGPSLFLLGTYANMPLRLVVTFIDGSGNPEEIVRDFGPIGLVLNGTGGADTIIGTDGSDDIFGLGGADLIHGGAGDDSIRGGGGNDTIFGDDGDDEIHGDGGADTIHGGAGNDTIYGGGGADTIFGDEGDDIIQGDGGADTIDGGAGDDTIIWNANAPGENDDGRDRIDGGEGIDTFVVNGNATQEHYTIWTRQEWIEFSNQNLNASTTNVNFDPDAEIIVTRNGTNFGSVIAQLRGIEEIVIHGGGGGDTFEIVGDFTNTTLLENTIRIEGSSGDDVIDISALRSAHRVVFRSNGGNDTILGSLRPQDVIELPAGSELSAFSASTVGGITVLSDGTHSVSFAAGPGGRPKVKVKDREEEYAWADDDDDDDDWDDDDHHDDDDDDDDDDSCGAGDGGAVVPGPAAGTGPLYQVGTASADVLIGTSGNDTLIGHGGDDTILGGAGDDVILGGAGNDYLFGDDGRDVIHGGDGNDDIFGGAGNDTLFGDGGNDRIYGGAGNDWINAGAGNDIVFAGAGDDRVVAEAGDGDDVYYGGDGDGDWGNDTLDMSSITADIIADLGTGFMGRGHVFSVQTGSDTIWGFENIITGSGSDTITASRAVNVMDGGGSGPDGHDTFRFLSAADADGDTILGFAPGDRIDLSMADANACLAGRQSFSLVTGEAFTGRGQLMVSHEAREDGDYTIVHLNTSGGAQADYKFAIKGSHNLSADDFHL
ncbi:peroxidase family protein [Mesorhizobium sp. YIM 152430]|uniref:peroxidase family protein n=1 Tax=Mesorhizobium sp. YIM 152430 TaxID=3031761 RepID=UPI0023DB2079|nr:peroxidase family protein [Mesorhizobium sp. YIM 152430]MDF1599319.1 peroxidase family protein [Mesorhizobium sp. YIM 152430]